MKRLLQNLAAGSIVLAIVLTAGSAWAGYKMEIDENRWISLGVGVRSHGGINENARTISSIDQDWGTNFDIAVRPYISGSVHENIKFEANLDTGGGGVALLDGIVKFEFSDLLNVWGGRMLPPTDRSNFSGPYFLNTWDFPGVAHRYPAIYAGRDTGAVAFGQLNGGQFKYQVGLFQGNAGANNPQVNARVVLNLLDPEPGYYNSSTYFGTKDILALGATLQHQKNGSTAGDDFTGWNVDLLFEKSFGDMGAAMVDAAYYGYDNDGSTAGTRADGDSFFVTAGWYLPGEYGCAGLKGQVQPHARYQEFNNDDGADTSRWDVGINWYILQQNAKFVLTYSTADDGVGGDAEGINLGFQLQF